MSTIQINDLKEHAVVDAKEASDVKGGPAYIKFDGIDGECRSGRPMESLSLNYTKITY